MGRPGTWDAQRHLYTHMFYIHISHKSVYHISIPKKVDPLLSVTKCLPNCWAMALKSIISRIHYSILHVCCMNRVLDIVVCTRSETFHRNKSILFLDQTNKQGISTSSSCSCTTLPTQFSINCSILRSTSLKPMVDLMSFLTFASSAGEKAVACLD